VDFRYSEFDGVNEWPFAQIAVRQSVEGFVSSAARLLAPQDPYQELVQRRGPISRPA
jgi:hypothetical protein